MRCGAAAEPPWPISVSCCRHDTLDPTSIRAPSQALMAAAAFNGTIWVYNRVGKAGSESLLDLFKQHCMVRMIGHLAPGGTKKHAVCAFDDEEACSEVLVRSIRAMRRRPALGQASQCRVVFGHFRY